MNKVPHIKHRTRHPQGDPTSRLLTECSAIFCPKPHHEFFHYDRPYGKGHQVSQQFRGSFKGLVEFFLFTKIIDVIQLVPDLNHALHSGTHEAVNRSEPTMDRSTPCDQLRYVGPAGGTMGPSDCVVGEVHGFAKAQSLPLALVELRNPCRLRGEHVRLGHQPGALLDDLLPKGALAL